MTQEELKRYSELNNKFISDCKRIAKILSGLEEPKQHEGCDITYANDFCLCGACVDWSGDEYWNYGGHEYHSGSFPEEYLTMTDDEIIAIVEKENMKYDEKKKAAKKIREEKDRAKRFKQYEELKKEFGK